MSEKEPWLIRVIKCIRDTWHSISTEKKVVALVVGILVGALLYISLDMWKAGGLVEDTKGKISGTK